MFNRMRLKWPPLVLLVASLFVAGLMMVSLPGAVENAFSSITLTWTPPTTNTDGTALTDLAGYRVYYGTSSGSYGSPIDVGNVSTYVISNLAAGSYYFAVTAYDTAGIESNFSNEVLKVEQGTADSTAPTVNTFTIPATSTSLTFSITSFTATDNVGVTGYIITESSTTPSATASGWSTAVPTTYTAAAAGTHTLYAYAKDAAGNVSTGKSASVNITIITTTDSTAPTVNTFTIPATSKSLTFAITSFTATDNVGVTGYIITESSTTPSATASGWSTAVPTTYTAAAAGTHTLYAYAKDAAGNVSTGKSASVNITIITTADTTRPTVNTFTIPATSKSLTFAITSITATDNVGVTGYIITESSTRPSATASGWSTAVPTTYAAAAAGTHTLYAYAKDAAGNVSTGKSASINITVAASALSDDIAIFVNGAWYIDSNGNGTWDGTTTDTFYPNFGNGLYSVVPVAGDWNGTGTAKIGVFSNGTWYLDMIGNGVWDPSVDKVIANFGQGLPNVIPVTGDWNGTGTTKIGVFSNGTWYLDMKGDGVWDGGIVDKVISNFGKGLPNVIPVTGDWDGTGTTKIGVFSNGTWYLDMIGNGVWDPSVDKVIANFGQGLPNVIPVTGDWNGTGTTKIGVFSNGIWYLDMNGNGIWDGASIDDEIPDFGKGLNGAIPVILKKK